MNSSAPFRGRALCLPLSLALGVAGTLANGQWRSDDGRPLLLAHDPDDRDRLLASIGPDPDDTIPVHAGQYVDKYGQVMQPSKDHYMLLVGGTAIRRRRRPRRF